MAKVKLGDVAFEYKQAYKGDKTGVPHVGLEHLIPGDVKLLRWDIDPDNTFTKGFAKGQVLLGRRRAYLRKAVVAPFDGICSGDITVIEAVRTKMDTNLLPFIIQNERFFDYATRGSAGSLSPRVKWAYLRNYEFDLPPLEEQERLAALLWAAYDLKESYKKLIAATDEMVKAHFVEMFGNPITNTKKWDTLAIKNVAPESPCNDRINGIAWILNLDMIESHSGKIIEKIYDDSSHFLSVQPFDDGNVLFSKLRPYLNKVVIPDEKGYATTELVPLRPNQEKLNKTFFSCLLRSDEFIKYANKIATGTRMPRMPLAELRNFECMLPPISMQNKFEQIVNQADKSKQELQQSMAKIDRVIKSLLP